MHVFHIKVVRKESQLCKTLSTEKEGIDTCVTSTLAHYGIKFHLQPLNFVKTADSKEIAISIKL